jgi:hypothetical protein
MSNSGPASNGITEEAPRRRAKRLSLVVPLEVQWQEPQGGTVTEPARTRDMSPHGALLLMKNFPRANAVVTLKNLLTGESSQGRVAQMRRSGEGKLLGVAVELLVPSETFWGLTFQLQSASLQLMSIESSFQTSKSGVDFRILGCLREVVGDLRQTAAAVQQWQELQLEGQDAYRVLDVVNRARVDRATHLLDELTADINSGAISPDHEEFGRFTRAVERLWERLTRRPVAFRDAQ